LSPLTLHRIRATLRSALNAAIREGLLPDNPAGYIELPTLAGRRRRCGPSTGERLSVAVWTAPLLAELLKFVAEDRLYAMWWLIAVCGFRMGEAAGLRWVDVDLDERAVMIAQQQITFGHTTTVGPPKTAASRRTIALDSTVRLLRMHRRRKEQESLEAGDWWVESGYVFTNPVGEPLNPDYLTRRFAYLVRTSGLPPVRLQDLRHGATLAHAAWGGSEDRAGAAGANQHRPDRRRVHQRPDGHAFQDRRGDRASDPGRFVVKLHGAVAGPNLPPCESSGEKP
jgi:integrase